MQCLKKLMGLYREKCKDVQRHTFLTRMQRYNSCVVETGKTLTRVCGTGLCIWAGIICIDRET